MRNNRLNSKNDNRKKKSLIIIGAVVAVVLIIAAIFGYNYWQNEERKKQANETANSFVAAVESQNYQEIANLSSPSLLEEIDYVKEDVQERYETIYGGIGVADISTENVQFNENEETGEFELQYDLHMTTSLGELPAQSYQTKLQEVDDKLFVDWHPNLIFPEMEVGDTVRISFETGDRGSIYDRNGELLAGASPAWQAGLYPARLGEGEERTKNLETIAETFETTTELLENILSASWVTEESFVPFTIVDEGETPEVTGVVYQETTARAYPLAEAGAHLIGYTGEVSAEDIEADPTLQPGDVIGKSGLEASYDDRLRGNKGGRINILDSAGEEKTVLQETIVENGEDITVTVDASLQEQYYSGLEGQSGAAVVTAPTTGELLVLTSSPSYNPTLMSRGISTEAYQIYAEDEETPFLPRYTARYAPGSTFKAITAAIGLDTGVTTLEETRTINGLQWKKDESWGDYAVTRVSSQPIEVDLEAALVYSDNIFFAQEVLEMGADTFLEGLNKFPFEETFELPFSMQPAQISNSGSFDSEGHLADTSFGQGQLLMSPLHQAIFFSPFANGGELVAPKLEATEDAQESIQPVTEETANTVQELLVQVVEDPNGTARGLNNSQKRLAAKTGTTEVQASHAEDGNDTNGFLLVFDAEEQSFLSVILIEDSSGSSIVSQFAPILEQQ